MAKKGLTPTPVRVIVRIGALKRFHTMKRKTAELPVVVSWDRRTADRRAVGTATPVERRDSDRRGPAPFTWKIADFVVVEEPEVNVKGETTKKTRRKIPAESW